MPVYRLKIRISGARQPITVHRLSAVHKPLMLSHIQIIGSTDMNEPLTLSAA
ncbi:MAG: hypothetical protein HC887_10990 [Desulfobacteraceae bacterium]|nr:hypothetical protein [Desulfobacteraceae bacterium]